MPGRPRLPRELKIIRGTFRKGREPDATPEPEKILDVPHPPVHLRPYAKAKWKQLAKKLVEMGLLTELDLTTLEICCAAYALAHEAGDAIYHPKRGKTQTLAQYMTIRNSQTCLELATMRAGWNTYKSYLTEFGLSPASRGKIAVKGPSAPEVDPMEKLLNEA